MPRQNSSRGAILDAGSSAVTQSSQSSEVPWHGYQRPSGRVFKTGRRIKSENKSKVRVHKDQFTVYSGDVGTTITVPVKDTGKTWSYAVTGHHFIRTRHESGAHAETEAERRADRERWRRLQLAISNRLIKSFMTDEPGESPLFTFFDDLPGERQLFTFFDDLQESDEPILITNLSYTNEGITATLSASWDKSRDAKVTVAKEVIQNTIDVNNCPPIIGEAVRSWLQKENSGS